MPPFKVAWLPIDEPDRWIIVDSKGTAVRGKVERFETKEEAETYIKEKLE